MKNLFTNVMETGKGGLVKGVAVTAGVVVVGLIAKAIMSRGKDEIELKSYTVKDAVENEDTNSESEPTGV